MCKRTIKIFIIIASVCFLIGCWDNKDINHRVMPVVLGVSKVGDEFKVYLQIPTLTNGKVETSVVEETGKSINEIIDKISTNMESQVDLLHIKVIVVDNQIAEEGFDKIISTFLRSRDIPSKALFSIYEDDLDTFFSNIKKGTGPEVTILLDCFEKNAGWTPEVALTRVWHIYRSMYSLTYDVAVPVIRLGKPTNVEQAGSGVIKEGKMVSKIDQKETLLYNAFNGESTQGIIEVMDIATVKILNNTIRHRSRIVEGIPELSTTVYLKVTILEAEKDATESIIKKQLSEQLGDRFNKMFTNLQQKESDILGIGQLFRNQLPRKELKKWRSKYYPRVSADIQFEVDIQNSGILKL
ncbi:Ger(x)C family spore germination protein [Robertmurraya massiliosenegalensis]|uniref:Ger(x)C family spore germination protein n=1 Tax=Robertmurraya TaxID=2837507 RepID=UPI0039A4DD57